MPTIDAQQVRRRVPLAAPIVGMVALSLLGACSVANSSQPAAVSSTQPTPQPPSSSSPAPSPGSTAPSAPASTPSAPAAPVVTLPPVPPGAPAPFGTGVSAQITAVQPITAVATAPGDIAGPALAISLSLANGGTEVVDADNVTVTASDATGAPASPVTGDQAQPFSGSIPPGAAQTATYPFRIPADAAKGALIVVSYRAGVPIATLTI